MFSIVHKPLIEYGPEQVLEADLSDISCVTGQCERAIEDPFDISYELELQIASTSKEALLGGIRKVISQCTYSYTCQIEMKGLGM